MTYNFVFNLEKTQMEFISEKNLLLLCCLFLSCFLIFTTSKFRRSSCRAATLPPGPPRLPIIGNIHQLGRNAHRSLAELSKTYGPIMSLKLGCLNLVVIASPESAREVLRTHDQIFFCRNSFISIRSINHHKFSVAWLHPSSARWRLLRRLSVTFMLSSQRIEATKALRLKKVQELVSFVSESSEREEAVDISLASFTTVLNITSNILFSVDLCRYHSKDFNEFQDTVISLMVAAGKPNAADFFPFLGFFDLQGIKKTMNVHTERLFRVFRRFIDAKIAEKSLRNDSKDASDMDFLDSLLTFTEGDEAELDLNDIEHLLWDMFIAGTDTNSTTVQWAMTELLKNPKTMAKAQAEIDRVIGQIGVVQESDISKLPYLQAVVKETFRFHPAVALLPRKAETNVEILGFTVPKDAQVLVNIWGMGRDPSVWENPTEFEPERFLGKEIDVKGIDYEFTPFGAGRRMCPGLPLAMQIVPLILASLLYSFDWKLPNGVVSENIDMDETLGLVLHKTNPLHAIPVKKRPMS